MSSIDVIVPCYRYGRFLPQCVESVLSQAGPSVRVLIIDDESPDDSAEVARQLAERDGRIAFRRHAQNKGHIATYNEGIEWASADYMLLLSADDYVLPGAFARAIELMKQQPSVGFVFGNVIELSETGDEQRIRPWHNNESVTVLTGQRFIEVSGPSNIVATPTAIVRTSVQKAVGGYRPELPHAGDMEMWWRFAARASVGFIDQDQAVYRRHASNMSKSYAAKRWMPDVEQRKLVLDYFFQLDTVQKWEVPHLRRQLYSGLATQTVDLASAAMNDGETAVAEQLLAFGVAMCPDVRTTWNWKKVALKRTVGARTWRWLDQSLGSYWRRVRRPDSSTD